MYICTHIVYAVQMYINNTCIVKNNNNNDNNGKRK